MEFVIRPLPKICNEKFILLTFSEIHSLKMSLILKWYLDLFEIIVFVSLYSYLNIAHHGLFSQYAINIKQIPFARKYGESA